MFDIFNTINEELSADEHMKNRAPAAAIGASDVFVISIGGSLIVDENGPTVEKIRSIADAISSLHSEGKRVVLVVGGGKIARHYVETMRSFNSNNFELDLLGIQITHANAKLIANAIHASHKEVLTKIEDAKSILDLGKIPVFGGLMPFFTTDSVGALLAEYLNGTFVNLTNVDGVFDSNPNENPNAQMFSEIGYAKLVSLIVQAGSVPGQNVVLDLACCLILQRSKITAAVLNGNDTINFSNYINGFSFKGTVIRGIAGDSVAEPHFVETTGKINEDIDQKPRKKKRRKNKGDSGHINPYHIDF